MNNHSAPKQSSLHHRPFQSRNCRFSGPHGNSRRRTSLLCPQPPSQFSVFRNSIASRSKSGLAPGRNSLRISVISWAAAPSSPRLSGRKGTLITPRAAAPRFRRRLDRRLDFSGPTSCPSCVAEEDPLQGHRFLMSCPAPWTAARHTPTFGAAASRIPARFRGSAPCPSGLKTFNSTSLFVSAVDCCSHGPPWFLPVEDFAFRRISRSHRVFLDLMSALPHADIGVTGKTRRGS